MTWIPPRCRAPAPAPAPAGGGAAAARPVEREPWAAGPPEAQEHGPVAGCELIHGGQEGPAEPEIQMGNRQGQSAEDARRHIHPDVRGLDTSQAGEEGEE